MKYPEQGDIDDDLTKNLSLNFPITWRWIKFIENANDIKAPKARSKLYY